MSDLTDVTFMISVRLDSPDRERNVKLITSYLRKHFTTNIFICEEDESPKVPSLLSKEMYDKYIFIQSDGQLLRHTKMINEMAKASNSRFIVNYDADVLFPPNQYYEAVEALRHNNVALVYPYDGRFFDVPSELIEKIVTNISVEGIDLNQCKRCYGFPATPDKQSFGGAGFFERNAFFAAGMANENFVSYGPEDIEFYFRFKKLGYPIHRISGPLYHMSHIRLMNSLDSHPMIANNYHEFDRIVSKTREELVNYISSWHWLK